LGSYWREACNITNQTEIVVMDRSNSEEGCENIAKQALDGIHREPGRPKQTCKRTV